MNKSNKKERWIDCYNSSQKILLVGEGDFSFSACLARAFRTAENMVATSYLDEDWLVQTHWTGVPHLEELERLGCLLLYEIDVYNMHKHSILKKMKFDIIIFNFPHAGHYDYLRESDQELIEMHKELVEAYFKSASKMLKEGGEVHIRHRDDPPYHTWDVVSLAGNAGLKLKEKVLFNKSKYHGYHHKRGGGINTNKTFPVGYAFTFKFAFDLPKVDDHHPKNDEVRVLEVHNDEVCVSEMKDRVHDDEVHAMKIKDQVHEDLHGVQSLEMNDQVHHPENDYKPNYGDEVHVSKMKGQVHCDDKVGQVHGDDKVGQVHDQHPTNDQVPDHVDEILLELKDDVDDCDGDANVLEINVNINEQHEKTSDKVHDVHVLKMKDDIHDYEHHMRNGEVNVDLDVHVVERKEDVDDDDVHVLEIEETEKNDQVLDHDHLIMNKEVNVDLVVHALERMHIVEEQHMKNGLHDDLNVLEMKDHGHKEQAKNENYTHVHKGLYLMDAIKDGDGDISEIKSYADDHYIVVKKDVFEDNVGYLHDHQDHVHA